MAFVAQIPENEQNKFGLQSPTTPNPVPPQTGGSSGGGSQGAAPGVGTPTQFGSNAAKLSDYLTANKDQASQFGQQVAGDLTNRYNQTVQGVNQGFSGFNQQINQGTPQPDWNQVNQAAEKPADFVKNPDNVSKFQGWYNGQYTGPQNFEGTGFYGDVNNQVNKAVQNSSLVGNQAGLGTYLNNFMGANDTTEGMRTLDTSLLLGNADSQKAIKAAAAPYNGLNDYLANTAQKANANVANAKDQSNQARQQIQSQFTGSNGVIPKFETNLKNRFNQTQTSVKTLSDSARSKLVAGQPLTQAELNALGATQGDIDRIRADAPLLKNDYGIDTDLASLVNEQSPDAALSLSNVATPEDFSNAAALQQLTGKNLSSFLDPNAASQAGTAPQSLLSFDKSIAQKNSDLLRQKDMETLNNYPVAYAGNDPQILTTLKDSYQRMMPFLNDSQRLFLHNRFGIDAPQQPNDNMNTRFRQIGNGTEYKSPLTGEWGQTPSETRRNQDGSWDKFNYDTGQYEPWKGTSAPVMGI